MLFSHFCLHHVLLRQVHSRKHQPHPTKHRTYLRFFCISRFFQCNLPRIKKPFNKIRLGLTCICFVGIVLVLQPSFIFHNNSTGPFKTSFEILVSLFSIFGAFCFSMTMVYVHDQSSKLSSMINLHYTYMSQMCFSGLVMNIMHSTIAFNEITYLDITLFFILVGISLIAQYMIYTANSLKKPSRTMPFGYVGVLAGFLADVFYFDIDFNLLSIIGMILTSIGLLGKLFMSE